MPLWAVAVFLLIAASVALGRSTGLGPFAAPPERTPPALTTAVADAERTQSPAIQPVDTGEIPDYAEVARVTRIIDGDTIDVEIIKGALAGQQQRIRYIGIDTPERDQPGFSAATNANRELVENRTLYLVKDRSETDVFDRLLRYLYLEDGTHVNAALVAGGWAQPVEYPPDIRHAAEFRSLAVEAADARRGFWSGDAPDEGAMSYGLTLDEGTIRRGPGEQFATNTTVPARTPLTVFGRTRDGAWLQVRPPSRDGGWIPAPAVDVRVPIDEIPVADGEEF